jgi:hypothetical protein
LCRAQIKVARPDFQTGRSIREIARMLEVSRNTAEIVVPTITVPLQGQLMHEAALSPQAAPVKPSP